jgi:hypothetical protein
VKNQNGAEQFELRIEQHFQELKASIVGQSAGLTVKNATLQGAEVQFTLADAKQRDRTLKGQVNGGSMQLSGDLGSGNTKLVATRQ